MRAPRSEDAGKKRRTEIKELPQAGVKIVDAMILLLGKKEFNAITTAEIMKISGANEALIYRYFGSKRGLLHYVLGKIAHDFLKNLEFKLKGIKGSLNKLRKIIWETIYLYQHDLVFAKILILEVRNYPGYFKSDTYKDVKRYAGIVHDIIKEGARDGEIRNDIPSWTIMQIVLGGVEHLSLPTLLFKKNQSTDELTEQLCNILFDGIKKI